MELIHTCYRIGDIDRSVAFYEALGFEERFLRFCDERGIPRPRVNEMIAGLEVDFSWPRLRLAVELDGWAFHRTRAAFERDRRRDTVLAAAGVRVLRFTHHQLTTTPGEVAGALQAPRSISSIR